MNSKGQALVEFILVIPVFLLILMAIIDFSNIYHNKYSLQNDLDVVTELYKDKKTDDYNNYAYNNKLELNITNNNELTTIEITKKVTIQTPVLNKILGNPYKIKESVTIYEK